MQMMFVIVMIIIMIMIIVIIVILQVKYIVCQSTTQLHYIIIIIYSILSLFD